MKGKLTAYLAAMTTITLWGLSYIWADRLLALGIPVEYFVPARSLAAGILLFCINKIARINIISFFYLRKFSHF